MHKQVFELLKKLNIDYTNYTHEPVFTVQEAKHVDDSIDAMPTKNLFLKDKKKNYFLVTAYAYQDIIIKDLAKKIGAKGGLSFAKPENLVEILDVQPGSVTPFCLINAKKNNKKVDFFLDNKLFEAKLIGIHPLRNDMTTVICPKDMQILVQYLTFNCNLLHL
jgi:Ala-tRNA(Pro) deacylase